MLKFYINSQKFKGGGDVTTAAECFVVTGDEFRVVAAFVFAIVQLKN